ncbi:Sucrase/ferredoxin-like-domain-containing protein [Suillus occidentalis]|nr:Sucrase/ferredoxin-like-domain-containing protein [Suillus occidentalis]
MPVFRALKSLVRSLSTTAISTSELAGTAPAHRCYIFLHTPQPPSEYPAKYATPIQRALLLRTAKWGGSVNFAWSEDQKSVCARPPGEEDKQEYHLTAFAHPRGKLEATVSMDNIDEVGERLRAHAEGVSGVTSSNSDDVHLYVCTHGARDCRCGDTGGAVAQAIRDELRKRRDSDPSDPSTCIKLAEVAHVGGHKYAANLLVYPHGEWLGEVEPEDVPEILDAILALPARPRNADEIPICPRHWRGRMGLSKDEQVQLLQRTYDT